MRIAARLIAGKYRRRAPLRRHISQPFAKTALTKLLRATEKLNGIIGAERRNASLHGAIVLVAERQNVGPHGVSLAFVDDALPSRTNEANVPLQSYPDAAHPTLRGPAGNICP
jgi:hypothetical protein